MSNRKKTELEKAQDFWYKKLKTSGFKDIEHKDGSINRPNSRSANWTDAQLRQLTQDYYCMAYHFLNEYKFAKKRDALIWEYHTEGLSIRNIVKVLKKAGVRNVNRINVWKTVTKLEDTMKGLYLST